MNPVSRYRRQFQQGRERLFLSRQELMETLGIKRLDSRTLERRLDALAEEWGAEYVIVGELEAQAGCVAFATAGKLEEVICTAIDGLKS
jgi:hypothetical protein